MTYAIHTCPSCGWNCYCDGDIPPHCCHKQERTMPDMETKTVYAHLDVTGTDNGKATVETMTGSPVWKGPHTTQSKFLEVHDPYFPPDSKITPANAKQISGDHYKQDAIQVWDFVAANNIPYFEATAIKYLCRWRRKGAGVNDLRKAIHFIEKLIEVESQRQ